VGMNGSANYRMVVSVEKALKSLTHKQTGTARWRRSTGPIPDPNNFTNEAGGWWK